jgi:hypothetical protein
VLTSDQSALFAERLKLAKPTDAVILPDVISKEPLAPVTRADDRAGTTSSSGSTSRLVNAEELGISRATADERPALAKPDVRRFVGRRGRSRQDARPRQRLGHPRREARWATTPRSMSAMSARPRKLGIPRG